MPEMKMYQHGKLVSTKSVTDETAGEMTKAFGDASDRSVQEWPKWIDTPNGRGVAQSPEHADELMAQEKVEGMAEPGSPMRATGTSQYVSPMYVGDGYGRVNNQVVSDDRHHEADEVTQDMSGIAKGPIRTNSQAAIQDVTFVAGTDPVQAIKDKAQSNKDVMSGAPEATGAANSRGPTVTTAAEMAQPAPVPPDVVADPGHNPEGDSSKAVPN